MSRIGKKPIAIPAGVDIVIEGGKVSIKGPKGELVRDFGSNVVIAKEDNNVIVSAKDGSKAARALWGSVRMHIANMVMGVTQGSSAELQIEGIGYRASLEGKNLVLNVGYTHPVVIEALPGIAYKVDKNIVSVTGYDKELVTKLAAQIRRVRPPEPYKGKGIRYVGEIVRKKVGKKAAATAK
jgi:large subunit ribosomal protein L6